jgi:hypothetical protein
MEGRMPLKRVNPAELSGEALRRWYLRSPDEIEQQRQAAEDERYRDFFGRSTGGGPAPRQAASPRIAASEEDLLWIANGRDGFRAIRPGASDFVSTLEPDASGGAPAFLPGRASERQDGDIINIVNPHNRRLKQEFIRKHGYWPKTPDGTDYDVSHIRAVGDGGTNTLDNIEPMDPDEHRAKHRRDRDAERFGKRPGIARAYGGRVEPPAHAYRPRGPKVRGGGLLGLIPGLADILGGRIRTDSATHFWNDMLGYSSEDDLPREDLIA